MNPPSMETIFLLLSGVILIAGVLYWFWSHLQLTQKKVQLLENAVFELRGMLASRTDSGPPPVMGGGSAGTVYKDLSDDEEWQEEAEAEAEVAAPVHAPTLRVEKVVDTVEEAEEVAPAAEDAEELQPGGRIEVPVSEEPDVSSAEQFRTLFTVEEGSAAPPASQGQSLEGMPVRELRQLAEKRGIKGAEAMKKKELLSALRAQAGSQTLDLTAMGVVKEDAEVATSIEEVDAVPVLE